MHRSGIVCNTQIKNDFKELKADKDMLFMRVEIEDEEFVKKGDGACGSSAEENFSIVQNTLEQKKPGYIIMRGTGIENAGSKFLLLYFVPDNSPVKKKMLIASSYADLKTGLGNNFFIGEYPMSLIEECTLAAYEKSVTQDDKKDLMTWQEREEMNSRHEEGGCMADSPVTAVVMGVPIPVDEKAQDAIASFQEGKVNTVVFSLEENKESLQAEETGVMAFDKLKGKLPEKEPRYILHNYEHKHEGKTKTKEIFIYYCPDKSKPKLRMFYSTAKANVLTTIEEYKIPEPKRVEISLKKELTDKAILLEIYPKQSVKKVFKKPTRRGKGKAKYRGKKFNPKA